MLNSYQERRISCGSQVKEKELREAQQKMEELAQILPMNLLREKLEKLAAWETIWEQQQLAAQADNRLRQDVPKLEAAVISICIHDEAHLRMLIWKCLRAQQPLTASCR